jgi:hypothetical protein
VEQLQNLADEYPYFAPAQFALTKKLAEEASPEYEAQIQKAVLYYHEPLYFDHFFNQDKYYAARADIEIIAEDEEENDKAPEEPFVEKEDINEEAQQVETIETTTESEITAPAISEEIPAEEPVIIVADEAVTEETVTEDIVTEEAVTEEPAPKEAVAVALPPEVDVTPEPVVFTSSPFAGASSKPLIEKEIVQPSNNKEPVLAANNKEDTLPFEPYHTIDYFASQGIRLSQEEATKDSLGKQLKSFTEWLKTMKRLPVQEQIKQVDPVSEQKVEHLAAHSVEGGDVVTETMAEVWIKQGNHQKAIDTYHKLSLLNPSKRDYFAAKIDSITREN